MEISIPSFILIGVPIFILCIGGNLPLIPVYVCYICILCIICSCNNLLCIICSCNNFLLSICAICCILLINICCIIPIFLLITFYINILFIRYCLSNFYLMSSLCFCNYTPFFIILHFLFSFVEFFLSFIVICWTHQIPCTIILFIIIYIYLFIGIIFFPCTIILCPIYIIILYYIISILTIFSSGFCPFFCSIPTFLTSITIFCIVTIILYTPSEFLLFLFFLILCICPYFPYIACCISFICLMLIPTTRIPTLNICCTIILVIIILIYGLIIENISFFSAIFPFLLGTGIVISIIISVVITIIYILFSILCFTYIIPFFPFYLEGWFFIILLYIASFGGTFNCFLAPLSGVVSLLVGIMFFIPVWPLFEIMISLWSALLTISPCICFCILIFLLICCFIVYCTCAAFNLFRSTPCFVILIFLVIVICVCSLLQYFIYGSICIISNIILLLNLLCLIIIFLSLLWIYFSCACYCIIPSILSVIICNYIFCCITILTPFYICLSIPLIIIQNPISICNRISISSLFKDRLNFINSNIERKNEEDNLLEDENIYYIDEKNVETLKKEMDKILE